MATYSESRANELAILTRDVLRELDVYKRQVVITPNEERFRRLPK